MVKYDGGGPCLREGRAGSLGNACEAKLGGTKYTPTHTHTHTKGTKVTGHASKHTSKRGTKNGIPKHLAGEAKT